MTERELLAQGIRRAILRAGSTTGEVARRLNTSYSTVAHWEAGASRPNATNLRKFASLLDVDPDDLRSGFPTFADPVDDDDSERVA